MRARLAELHGQGRDGEEELAALLASGHPTAMEARTLFLLDVAATVPKGAVSAQLRPLAQLIALSDLTALDHEAIVGALVKAVGSGKRTIGRTLAELVAAAKGEGKRRDEPTRDEVVAEMNRSFALVGKDFLIADELGQEVVFRPEAAMRRLYSNKVVIEGEGRNSRSVSLFDIWMTHPDRREFTTQPVFDPSDDPPGDAINLYRGPAVVPVPGNWSMLREHLFENICRGDLGHFIYLLNWFALLFQDPANKIGTSIVLRGLKGTGKTKVGQWMSKPFGRHAFSLSKPGQVMGRFNAHLGHALLVTVEEAFWAGGKEAESIIKDMITSDEQIIEPKGIDAFRVKNYIRLLILGNNKWMVPATEDERRFFVLDVGDDRMQDEVYFAALDAQMHAGGLAGMYHDLLRWPWCSTACVILRRQEG